MEIASDRMKAMQIIDRSAIRDVTLKQRLIKPPGCYERMIKSL